MKVVADCDVGPLRTVEHLLEAFYEWRVGSSVEDIHCQIVGPEVLSLHSAHNLSRPDSRTWKLFDRFRSLERKFAIIRAPLTF